MTCAPVKALIHLAPAWPVLWNIILFYIGVAYEPVTLNGYSSIGTLRICSADAVDRTCRCRNNGYVDARNCSVTEKGWSYDAEGCGTSRHDNFPTLASRHSHGIHCCGMESIIMLMHIINLPSFQSVTSVLG